MANTLTRNWWLIALSGIIAVLFGIIAFVYPGMSLAILLAVFGVYALLGGIFAAIAAIRHREEDSQWWLLLLIGLVGIAAGIITFIYPRVTALTVLYIIAAWAIVTGVLEIAAAIGLRQEIDGEWMLLLAGVVSVLFGILAIIYPSAGVLTILWLIGIYHAHLWRPPDYPRIPRPKSARRGDREHYLTDGASGSAPNGER